MVEQPIKKVQVRCQICYVNQCLFHYIETWTIAKTLFHKTLCLSLLFLFCVNGTPSFLAIVARHFMSADFTSHCICLTSVTIPLCGPVHRVQSIKQVRGSLLSGIGIRFQNLNLLQFDQITGLKSLSIYLFLLARLNLGLQMDRLPVQASQEALCLEREREREREGGERERRLFKQCRNLPAHHCVAGVQAVLAISEPTCRALCYRGAGCISDVGTYLPGTVLQ